MTKEEKLLLNELGNVQSDINILQQKLEQLLSKKDDAIKKLVKKMKDKNLKEIFDNGVQFKIVDSYTKVQLDSTRLKEEMPEIVELYKKEVLVKESYRINLKK